jgi:hypothetical protein
MTHDDSKKLLDSIKDGAQYPAEVVAKALDMSGDQRDYTYLPSTEIDEFVQALREGGAI